MSDRFRPRYTRRQLEEAIAASRSWAETLRRVGLRPAGGNFRTVQRHAEAWAIATDHFDPTVARDRALRAATQKRPLGELLVEGSSYSRSHLKARLYAERVKERRCELCGQGEEWRGARMSLILDHVNGVANDHRLENLRIVCPNCAATLETHCGRNRPVPRPRACAWCGERFEPLAASQQYCSRACGLHAPGPRGPRLSRRKVERPSSGQLAEEVRGSSYAAVGRRYGVSDNAVRKWVAAYERDAHLVAGQSMPDGDGGSERSVRAPARR